jgi:hypothetical protein
VNKSIRTQQYDGELCGYRRVAWSDSLVARRLRTEEREAGSVTSLLSIALSL